MKYIKSSILFLLMLVSYQIQAQNLRGESVLEMEKKGWIYELKGGINIGGTSPLPLPEEIREIKKYDPTLSGWLEGSITQWFKQGKWGLSTAIRFENKGMSTKARVKNYGMELIEGADRVKGRWTGNVNTEVKNTFLTLLIPVKYRVNKRLDLNFGPYISFLLKGEFGGFVSDGYLREGDPTGAKFEFKDGKIGTYNFDDEIRTFHYGLNAGCSWKAYKLLSVHTSLNWGLNNIFKKDFKTISFNLYPIYLSVGVGYTF